MGKFNNKVIVITGAGGGIGRAHALAFAKEGAKVVVNDLGSARDGTGQAHRMADQVVDEIKKNGGIAVANYDSVADLAGARNIIKTAVDNFGRLDILVNNAGILRDKTLLNMTEDMWDLVIAVHLKGTFACSQAAAVVMKEQKYGRIINTSSFAGLIGNFGQTNYSAAKAGIYGFSRSLAQEVEKYGITVNVIAPIAKTRMTEDITTVPEDYKPEQITPMVMFLASDYAKNITGRVFGIHGQLLLEYKMMMSPGVEKPAGSFWTIDEINNKIDDISKMTSVSSTTNAVSGIDPNTILKINDVLKSVGLQLANVGSINASQVGSIPSTSVATGTEPSLSVMFQKMADVFMPDKAGDFKGIFQYDISGDQPQAIYVENGKVKIVSEKATSPSVTITTSKETMIALLKGEIDVNKAFMQGKIKADKMPVLMKFSAFFNLNDLPNKVKSLFASPTSKASPSSSTSTSASTSPTPAPAKTPSDIGGQSLSSLFMLLSKVFMPDKAGDFKGTFQFEISGDQPQAIYVDAGTCQIKSEKTNNPAVTVTTDKETMMSIFTGKLAPNKAFMQGKLKADKMPVLMKFNAMFDLEKFPSVLKTTEKTETSPVTTGMNRAFIGKWYKGSSEHVKPEKIKDYASATNEKNPKYFGTIEEELFVPPIFPVTLNSELVQTVAMDDNLHMDLLRMVHGEHEIKYLRPLKPWDLVYTTAEIIGIDTVSSGEIMSIKVYGKVEGLTVYEMVAKLFVRSGSRSKDKSTKEPEPLPSGKPVFSESMKVAPDQSIRYAKASGDNNPIHLDESVAKAAGLQNIILHGLCTMAFASKAIVDNLLNGNPKRLQRIKVRFSSPVYMNDQLTTTGWEGPKDQKGNRTILFETIRQDGTKILAQGEATLLS